MKEHNTKQFEDSLRSLPISPEKSWQAEAERDLENLISKDVPKHSIFRNSILNLFNFINIFRMQTKTRLLVVFAVVVGFFGLTTVAAYASDEAKPGDALYGVDRAFEKVAMFFKFGDEAKAQFAMDLLEERMGELEQMQSSGEDAEKLQNALKEMEQQQEAVQERVREMEESTENRNEDAELERIQNRNEEQNEEAEQLKNQVKNQNVDDIEGENLNTVEDPDDAPGEPGGTGFQEQDRPRNQQPDSGEDQMGDGDETGDGDQPREKNGKGYE